MWQGRRCHAAESRCWGLEVSALDDDDDDVDRDNDDDVDRDNGN